MKKSLHIHFVCLMSLMHGWVVNGSCQAERAPAYPLITHNTYFSLWSFSDALNGSTTKHWTGANQALNGLIKVDNTTYNFLGTTAVSPYTTILPASDEADYTCRYTLTDPRTGWEGVGFTDATWNVGGAPFGDDAAKAKTLWKTKDIWVRRSFALADTAATKLYLKLFHDDVVQVYLNGTQVFKTPGWNYDFEYFPISNLLQPGENLLAVHCRNNQGGAGLDFGLSDKPVADAQQIIKTATQQSVTMTATQTKYKFTCGKVDLAVTFTSPLLIPDINIYSRPVSYISFAATSNDGNVHDVKVYLGAASDLARNNTSQEVTVSEYTSGSLSVLKAGTPGQPVLQKQQEVIDWGYLYVAVPLSYSAAQYISKSTSNVNPFFSDTASNTATGKVQVLSTIIPFGQVGNAVKKKYIEVGYDEIQSVQLFGQNLPPWWKKNGTTIEQVLNKAAAEYPSVISQCNLLDDSLYQAAAAAGGEPYAKLCAIAYRQSIAAHQLVKSPFGNDLLFLSKENSSGSFMSTVDVSFPAIPLYLLLSPELAKGMLNGILFYCESGRWKKEFAPHDMGTYPFGNGQTYFFDMPIEETANMILMAAGVAKAEGNAGYAAKHWLQLTKWVDYLVSQGYNPPYQLTSDDFAGAIAQSVNLSAKSICAIGAYAGLAQELGDTAAANNYHSIAKSWADQWVIKANAGDHYLLAFNQPGTWSQKYNMVWDKLLGMDLFPQSVYDKESAYYITKQNEYGFPLDNRETYTKSDWLLWSATLGNDSVFKVLAAPVYAYSQETGSRVPISDFHQTITGLQQGFQARSVVGGYFIKLLEKQWSAATTKPLVPGHDETITGSKISQGISAMVQPNPVKDVLYVEVFSAKGKISVSLADGSGKVVYRKRLNGGAYINSGHKCP